MEMRARYGLTVEEPTDYEWTLLLGLKRGRDKITERREKKREEEFEELRRKAGRK